jgi:hypothetical protein
MSSSRKEEGFAATTMSSKKHGRFSQFSSVKSASMGL